MVWSGEDTVFYEACRYGMVNEARGLGTPQRTQLKDKEERTPLYWACIGGHEAVVRFLVEELGADVNVGESLGRMPLTMACFRGHDAIARFLVEDCAARINVQDALYNTPLKAARAKGHTALADYLESQAKIGDSERKRRAAEKKKAAAEKAAAEKAAAEKAAAEKAAAEKAAAKKAYAEEAAAEKAAAEEAAAEKSAAEEAAAEEAAMLAFLTLMRASERTHREAAATSFYFVRADKLRGCTLQSLPRLQDLQRDHADWIERLPVDLTSALLGEYRERFCGVSHRWETPNEPDTKGTQLAALKGFLSSHPEIEYVWFDFSSMPQKPRSAEEDAMFGTMLEGVDVIYLGMQVLIMLDMQYIGRFWTQAEAWMSMQAASTSGVTEASHGQRRYTVVPLYNANALMSDALISMWSGKTAKEAHDGLAQPDVFVTNQKDKNVHLPKILRLDETVKHSLAVHQRRDAAVQELARAMAAKDSPAIEAALAKAEAAGVAPETLQTGRAKAEQIRSAGRLRQQALKQALDWFREVERRTTSLGIQLTYSGIGGKLRLTAYTEVDGATDECQLDEVAAADGQSIGTASTASEAFALPPLEAPLEAAEITLPQKRSTTLARLLGALKSGPESGRTWGGKLRSEAAKTRLPRGASSKSKAEIASEYQQQV